jgi:hypothetical protein
MTGIALLIGLVILVSRSSTSSDSPRVRDHPMPKGTVTHLGAWHVRESGWGGFLTGAELSLAVGPSHLQIWVGDPLQWTGQDFELSKLTASVDGAGVRITREKGKPLGVFDPSEGTDRGALLGALGARSPQPATQIMGWARSPRSAIQDYPSNVARARVAVRASLWRRACVDSAGSTWRSTTAISRR